MESLQRIRDMKHIGFKNQRESKQHIDDTA
jgi:hypothetical protein